MDRIKKLKMGLKFGKRTCVVGHEYGRSRGGYRRKLKDISGFVGGLRVF
jgi:hypothetical protein